MALLGFPFRPSLRIECPDLAMGDIAARTKESRAHSNATCSKPASGDVPMSGTGPPRGSAHGSELICAYFREDLVRRTRQRRVGRILATVVPR